MARIETENGDTFEIAKASMQGTEGGVFLTAGDTGPYWLTPSEARRIATALTTMADTIDAPESVRPEVVGLLASIDPHGTPDQWTHADGRPLTDDERNTALSATAAELQAAAAQLRDDQH
jgi:hypothetical protein